MKVGVLTYWNSSDNYGQQLQCFAMQRALRELGHEPFHIRYIQSIVTKKHSKGLTRYITDFGAYVRYTRHLLRERLYASRVDNSPRGFDKFRSRYLTMSEEEYDSTTLMNNPPEADAFIAGSDQIWAGDIMYYLPFVSDSQLRIGYAPSTGGQDITLRDDSTAVLDLLRKFDFIGMREASGRDSLLRAGVKGVTTVVDPALLLDGNTYINTFGLRHEEYRRGLVYMLGHDTSKSIKSIDKMMRKRGFDYDYVASQGTYDRFPHCSATVIEWMEKIMNASLVVTNSFHCTVFSMLFHRPFIFVPMTGSYKRMNDRLFDLLGNVGLQSQICVGNLDEMPVNPDFTTFDRWHKTEKEKSITLLKAALEK